MSRLISDPLLRRICQGGILAGLSLLAVLQAAVIFLLIGRHLSWFTTPPEFQLAVFDLLQFPFDKEFASFSMLVAGVIPVAVSGVCYRLDPDAHAPTDGLNRTGRIAVVLLMLGVLLGIVAIIVMGVYAPDFTAMVGSGELSSNAQDDPARLAVRNTLTAVLGFQTLYFFQLLGVKS